MDHIRHIFFDLDHTIWDFETNSKNTLRDLVGLFTEQIGFELDFEEFYPVYHEINEEMWQHFRENRINSAFLRHFRFRQAFSRFGVPDAPWIDEFGHAYLTTCPTKSDLMPNAKETIRFLHQHYPLHLITNGFNETQHAKLKHAKLSRFFKKVITSESANAKKPDPVIFNLAMTEANATPETSLYIGDHYETDVLGGINAGMTTVFFNPDGKPNPIQAPEIHDLKQLISLLKP
jgi:putative hydrolase of the HAD superfamily